MLFFSTEFWVGFQMIVLVILVFMLVLHIRKLKTSVQEEVSKQVLEQVIGMIEPLLREANETAQLFQAQIKEKSSLIQSLNEKLDSRIISLNLLLNRSETYLMTVEQSSDNSSPGHVYDQQEAILSMYENGSDANQIAQKLSMPKGEVDLVINLKKKFVSLE